ncbi:MAG: PssE/Cps14G family polysaccharide biosynthesis glycosyltransferase [Candidatus Odinarchaeia archaeon]
MKIFVTVGTSKFDELILKVDEFIKNNPKYQVIGQIGFTEYKPKYFYRYFKFTRKIDKYYRWAELIISHGGAGTLYDILKNGKKAIVFPNEKLVTDHQIELIDKFSKLGYILKGDLNTLDELIASIKDFTPIPYKKPKNRISDILVKYLQSLLPSKTSHTST